MATLSSTAAKRKGESLLTGRSAPKTSKSAPRSKAGGAKQSKAKPPKSANASMATLSSTAAKRKGGSAPKTSKSAPRSKAGGAKQSKASPLKSANGSMATLSSTVAKRKGESLLTASMKDIPVKDDDLEGLSLKLSGTDWEALARRLKFQDPEITAFDKENEEYPKKAVKMLFQWKRRDGSKATYRVLHAALSHEFVNRRDLAEKFC